MNFEQNRTNSARWVQKKLSLSKSGDSSSCKLQTLFTLRFCPCLLSCLVYPSLHNLTANLTQQINYCFNLFCSLNRVIVNELPYAVISPLTGLEKLYNSSIVPTSNSLRWSVSVNMPGSLIQCTVVTVWLCTDTDTEVKLMLLYFMPLHFIRKDKLSRFSFPFYNKVSSL